ncbi:MAG: hypothetical protein ACOH17_08890 [Cellulomonas sp.]
MSTTTPTGQHHLADVASYAAAVRRQLVGLSSEQVEDLTDGLEADLGDALADPLGIPQGVGDKADLTVRFGSPTAYAQELRAAAGLPDAGAPVPRRPVRRLLTAPVRAADRTVHDSLDRLRERQWWPPVEEFLATLAPAVWLLRGGLVARVVSVVLRVMVPDGGAGSRWLPSTILDWLLLVGFCVVSVQWGRGRWQRGRWSRRARVAATTVAVVAALPVFATAVAHDARPAGAATEYQTVYTPQEPQDGVVVGGMTVSNLFAYDAAGNPIDDVQIFDDRGRPVRTMTGAANDEWSLPGVAEPWSFVSAQTADGRQLWNVYPLLGGPSTSFEWNDSLQQRALAGGVTAKNPPRPFAKAPAVTPSGAMTTGPLTGASTDPTTGAATGPSAGATTDQAPVSPESASALPTSTP